MFFLNSYSICLFVFLFRLVFSYFILGSDCLALHGEDLSLLTFALKFWFKALGVFHEVIVGKIIFDKAATLAAAFRMDQVKFVEGNI